MAVKRNHILTITEAKKKVIDYRYTFNRSCTTRTLNSYDAINLIMIINN